MAWLTADFAYFAFWFVVILTVLVFVHEFGHYLVARWNGVRIEVFSIGFGPEIFGWNDRAGTRWKFSAIPLGGYVKMFGDADPASMPSGQVQEMSAAERAVSFHHKRLMQRVAVVSAGPLANFVFPIAVTPKSAAAAGGIKPGDVILSINGQRIERFEDVQRIVRLDAGVPLTMKVRRGNEIVTLSVTPRLSEVTDRFGNKHEFGLLGIEGKGLKYIRYNPVAALGRASAETWELTAGTLHAVWQMIIGARSTDELGGPLRIAQMSGEVAEYGLAAVLAFMAVLSLNLGLL